MSEPDDSEPDYVRREAHQWAAMRQKWLAEHPSLPIEEFARHAGIPGPDPISVVRRWQDEQRVFAVFQDGVELYPAFLLAPDGQPRPAFHPVIKILREEPDGYRGWMLATWLTRPSAEFADWQTPLEMIDRDLEGVIKAAKRAREEIVY